MVGSESHNIRICQACRPTGIVIQSTALVASVRYCVTLFFKFNFNQGITIYDVSNLKNATPAWSLDFYVTLYVC